MENTEGIKGKYLTLLFKSTMREIKNKLGLSCAKLRQA